MHRDRRHFVLNDLGREQRFKSKVGGGTKPPSDVADRAAHASALLHALDLLPDVAAEKLPGVYIDIKGRLGEPMITSAMNASGLELLKYRPPDPKENVPASATVFASPKGLDKLRRKIEDFAGKNRQKEDGSEGRPFNANLIQSVGAIVEAGLRALWRSPPARFPQGDGIAPWEVWLDKAHADEFISGAIQHKVVVGSERLDFPEDLVVIATGTKDDLALAVRRLAGVRALGSGPINLA